MRTGILAPALLAAIVAPALTAPAAADAGPDARRDVARDVARDVLAWEIATNMSALRAGLDALVDAGGFPVREFIVRDMARLTGRAPATVMFGAVLRDIYLLPADERQAVLAAYRALSEFDWPRTEAHWALAFEENTADAPSGLIDEMARAMCAQLPALTALGLSRANMTRDGISYLFMFWPEKVWPLDGIDVDDPEAICAVIAETAPAWQRPQIP